MTLRKAIIFIAIYLVLLNKALSEETPVYNDPLRHSGSQMEYIPQRMFGHFDNPEALKIESLENRGMKVASQDQTRHLSSILPFKIEDVLKGNVYFEDLDQSNKFYIFYFKSDVTVRHVIHKLNNCKSDWLMFREPDGSNSITAINISHPIAISITHWKNSRPSCAILELTQ